jgi:hypothetical protein
MQVEPPTGRHIRFERSKKENYCQQVAGIAIVPLSIFQQIRLQ